MSNTLSQTPFFIPTQISGCTLWYDGNDALSISLNGSNVTQWNDKSGNNSHATQATLLKTGTWSNPGVKMSSSSWYNIASSTYTKSHSMFVVATGSSSAGYFVGRNPATGGGPTIIISFSGTSIEYFDQVQRYTINGSSSTSTRFLANYTRQSGGNIIGVYNGSVSFTQSQTYDNGTSPGWSYLNSSQGDAYSDRTNSLFLEIIIYNSSLSTSQRQQVEGYLAWKWGLVSNLPSSHPFKLKPVGVYALPPAFRNVSAFPLVSGAQFPFSPLSITGCQLWLDAADSSTFRLSGSNVLQWNDKSGNGRNASSVSGTPTYTNNSVSFVAANADLLRTSASITITQYSTAVFIVANLSPSASSTTFYDMFAFPDIQWGEYTGANSVRYYNNVLIGVAGNGDTYDIGNNNYYINGTFNTALANYTSRHMLNCIVQNGSGTTRINISDSAFGRYFWGNVNEVIIYNSITTAQRQQVEGYLAWKWGLQNSLPANHPFARSQPNLPGFSGTLPPRITMASGQYGPLKVSGCQIWLDAADSSSLIFSSGSNVSSWRDKSGNGYNVTSGGTAPRYSSASNAVVFNGNGYLINTVFTLPLANRSIFIVASQTASSSNVFEGILVFGNSNVVDYNSSNALVYNGRGSNVNANCSFGAFFNYAFNSSGDYKVNYGNYLTPAPFAIYNDVFSNPRGTLFVDGNTTDSDSIGGGIGTSTAFFLGARNDSGNGIYRSFLNGSIFEIIVYNVALSTQQRQNMEGYLAWKWGLVGNLPGNHPYKKFPPPP